MRPHSKQLVAVACLLAGCGKAESKVETASVNASASEVPAETKPFPSSAINIAKPSAEEPIRTAAQLKAARNFAVGKISFSTNLAELRSLHLGGLPDGYVDTKLGDSAFIAKSETPSYVIVHCFDDKVRGIELYYNTEEIDRLGGIMEIINRLKKRFGDEDLASKKAYLWLIPSENREILVTIPAEWKDWNTHQNEAGIVVLIVNTEVEHARSQRQKDLDAGF